MADICLRALQSNIFALSVAGSTNKFNVHLGELEKKCKVVYAAATRDFKESLDGCYVFQETSEETLERFIEWLYTGQYSFDVQLQKEEVFSTPRKGSSAVPPRVENTLLQHGHLYVLASIYLVDELKILITTNIATALRSLYPTSSLVLTRVIELLNFAFYHIEGEDPLLELLGKYSARCIIPLRGQPTFIKLLPKAGPTIIKYVCPNSNSF